MTKIDTATNRAGGEQMTAEWYRWLVENALRFTPGQEIVNAMVASGFTERAATDAVNAAITDPHLAAVAELGLGREGAPSQNSARADKLAWFMEATRRNAKMAPSWGTIARVHKPSREEFLEDFYSKNRPVVIEGALDDWPAMTKWTGEYLKEKCGDQPVEIQANRNSDDDYELNSESHKKQIPFREAVDLIESGVETNDVYITANNSGINKQSLRALWDDIRFPDYLDPSAENDGFFWYGPKGVVTPIHHDLTNNFMAQVRGRKLVRLIAPWESTDVYNHTHVFSQIDIMDPDLEKHPRMKNVDIIDVEIGPGDLFFLPVGWWHGVKGLDLSITMTFTNFVFENDFFTFHPDGGAIG